jgi:hypothetical protein
LLLRASGKRRLKLPVQTAMPLYSELRFLVLSVYASDGNSHNNGNL